MFPSSSVPKIEVVAMGMSDAVPFQQEESPFVEPAEDARTSSTEVARSSFKQPSAKRKNFEDDDVSEENEDANEDEEDMEDVMEIPPYKATTEEMPRCAVYHSKFVTAQACVSKIIELVQGPLDASSYTDGNVDALKDDVKKREKARYPEEIRFGLVGDMGTGKSSMNNSILGVGIMARKSDMGKSCTWVVQEFRKPLAKQNLPFGAEIEYYDERERQDIIASLLDDAYDYASSTSKTEDFDDFQEVDSSPQEQEHKMIGHSALQALHALCRNLPDCSTEEAMADFIAQAKSGTDGDMINKLVKRTENTLGKKIRKCGNLFVEAETPEDLLTKLRKYTMNAADADDENEEDASHWPMIKLIRFGLSTGLTEQNIVLVDVPGTRDINRVRHKTVTRALSTCNHYLVLANITRAEDDDTLIKYLTQGYNRLGSGRAVAICTHTDRIDRASGIPKSGPRREAYRKVLEEVESLGTHEHRLKSKMDKAKGLRKMSTYDELVNVQSKSADRKAEEESLRISERNKQISSNLKATYRSLTGDRNPLSVFTISNSAYEQYQTGIRTREDRPKLSVAATQIPALRRHLYAATAKGRFNSVLWHAERSLPSLLANFELWCAKTHMKRKKEIEKIVMLPLNTYPQALNNNFAALEDFMRTEVLMPMKLNEVKWNTIAAKTCGAWAADNKTAPYLTLVKSHGFRNRRNKKAKVNWNGELLAIMAPDLKRAFRALAETCAKQERSLNEKLERLLENMKDLIQADPQWKLMALTPLINKIDAEKAVMQEAVERGFNDLKHRLDTLQDQVINDCDDSVVAECMEKIYAEVMAIRGAGSGKDRPKKMRERVSTAGGLWSNVRDAIKTRFMADIKEIQSDLNRKVGYIFKDIHAGFNRVCQDKPHEGFEERKLRVKLSENLVEARKILDGELKEALAECKQWA